MIAVIAAVGSDNVIGRKNALPWRSAADLRRFKQMTLGHAVVMGRRTHESIGRALPGRRNIVVSRSLKTAPDGCELAASLPAAIELGKQNGGDIFIIGGAQIYRQALPLADCLHITEVEITTPDGDAFFPDFDKSEWTIKRETGDAETPRIAFVTYTRRRAPQKS